MTRNPDASTHGPVPEGQSLNDAAFVPEKIREQLTPEAAQRVGSRIRERIEEVKRVPTRPGRTTIKGLPATAADALVSQLTTRELFALRRARRHARERKAAQTIEHTPEENRRDAMRLLAKALWSGSPPPVFQFTWDLFGVDELAEALGPEAGWDHAALTVTVNDQSYQVKTSPDGVDLVLVTKAQPSSSEPAVSPPEAVPDGDRVP